ncbi:MAG: OB-fold domain-containing protein [Burkholderiales bacterium]
MTTLSQDRPLAAPIVNPETEPFWQAAAQGKLLLKRSVADGRVHWYPRALCPYTLADTEWFESIGSGVIYSVSVTRRAGPIPYAIAYVTLDEGVTLLSNIVDCDLDALRIGQRVKVCFKPAEGGAVIPMFTPA